MFPCNNSIKLKIESAVLEFFREKSAVCQIKKIAENAVSSSVWEFVTCLLLYIIYDKILVKLQRALGRVGKKYVFKYAKQLTNLT